MIRIAGGIYRGRKLRVPRTGVRPTKDMVRQALFSAIGETLQGKSMADIFAGSGAVGIEALSRGACDAYWVEDNARTFQLLEENVKSIDPAQAVHCVRADAFFWLKSSAMLRELDMIYADPPYEPEAEGAWGTRLLEALTKSMRLKAEGLFVLEQHVDEPVVDNPDWDLLKASRYGETHLVYYRKKPS